MAAWNGSGEDPRSVVSQIWLLPPEMNAVIRFCIVVVVEWSFRICSHRIASHHICFLGMRYALYNEETLD